jgi:uncharacterized protein YijF (DUF1287 family)
MDRRAFLLASAAALVPTPPRERSRDTMSPPQKLIVAARTQIGVTTLYDPAYLRLPFPGGDPPRERGVCTDVVVRAYRDAFDLDLQKEINADMRRDFAAYPRRWGLKAPDPNIDHRRVPNLQTFFRRRGRELPLPADPSGYDPGDLVTQMLPGQLPHIVIVADERGAANRPLVVHNVGRGARLEDVLTVWPVTGRYRYGPLVA